MNYIVAVTWILCGGFIIHINDNLNNAGIFFLVAGIYMLVKKLTPKE